MAYTVFIPTAGTGSRLGGITKYLNKSLVSIGNKPTITRIFEMFPEDTRYVIALGYKGELVREYLSLAHPEKDITLVDIYPYEGSGSGLGFTMLSCAKYLQEPFVFCSCDTLVAERIPAPDHNWMGYDNRDNVSQYRTLSFTSEGKIWQINEKGKNPESHPEPYIGLAGIHDYKAFWNAMTDHQAQSVAEGEAFGLRQLLPHGVAAHKFTWFDTGITVELEATQKRFHQSGDPNILPKADETIWLLKDRVVKFSDNVSFIENRVKRAGLLGGYVPRIMGHTRHMYCYTYVDGDVMSRCVTLPLFSKLLDYSKHFWTRTDLTEEQKKEFHNSCMKFYRDKTYERVQVFYRNFDREDNAFVINGREYPALQAMLDRVDWEYVADGMAGQFHGDFHFENILYDKGKDEFCFLDWRQCFDKSISVGDIYYDLGKMLHGLIMCHELVARNLFEVSWQGSEIKYDFNRKHILVQCEEFYYRWLGKNGYDEKKTRLMAALIFLNICGLHEYPYSLVLYALGKEMLYNSLNE